MSNTVRSKIIISIIVALGLFGLILILNTPNQGIVRKQPKEDEQSARQDEQLSPRETRIEEYLKNPDDNVNVTRFTFGTRNFSLIDYRSGYASSGPTAWGGIIVFEGTKIVWESEEGIDHVSGETSLRDINSDNINEIFVTDGGGGNTTNCILYIYQWRDGTFHLISPYEELNPQAGKFTKMSTVENCGSAIRDGFLKDLDGDGVDELIQTNRKATKKIYKFNGTEYKLWKEEPGLPYNPKDWEPNNG